MTHLSKHFFSSNLHSNLSDKLWKVTKIKNDIIKVIPNFACMEANRQTKKTVIGDTICIFPDLTLLGQLQPPFPIKTNVRQ